MTPAPWLADYRHLLPAGGEALDVACGSGRHALWLAGQGFAVRAVDRDRSAVQTVRVAAAQQGLPVTADVVDLEGEGVSLGRGAYDLVVVVHYLHRPLFPALIAALRSGGVLVYETFTREQAARGRPTNPDYLLAPGELRALVHPLAIVLEREGDFEGKMLASVIARAAAR